MRDEVGRRTALRQERTAIEQAVAAWRATLGAGHVLEYAGTCSAAQTATYATTTRVPAVLRPGSTDDVQACMRIANRFGTPVYPVSGGRNYGFGSRVPHRDCAIMDLSRMNAIVDFDESLGYVTVEPGVTFGQMHGFLAGRQARVVMSVPSTSPQASLVGHAVERGPGRGPAGDRFGQACAMEVVLPTGERIHTGLDRFDGAAAAPLYHYGVGPYLDGMFSQANLGVVTKMTFWLAPFPSHVLNFTFAVTSRGNLPVAIDAIRPLLLKGLIGPGSFGMWSKERLLADLCTVEWDDGNRDCVIPPAEVDRRLRQTFVGRLFGVHAWYGHGTVYAYSRRQRAAARAMIRHALRGKVDRLQFRVPDLALRLVEARRAATGRRLLSFDNVRRISRPDEPRAAAAARLHRWRKPASIGGGDDPDRERCGFIWLTPTLPLDGRAVERAATAAAETLLSWRFDPILALVPLSHRAVEMLCAIVYDRDQPGADARAAGCHDALLERMCALGYYPYRLNHLSMKALPAGRDDFELLVRKLKTALDPQDILAPGRYDFRVSTAGSPTEPCRRGASPP